MRWTEEYSSAKVNFGRHLRQHLHFRHPMSPVDGDITQILSEVKKGGQQASEELLPLVYNELRRLAAQKLSHERPGQTLNATALVHEAYLRLVGSYDQHWDGRGHFFAAAAEAMRRILVDSARRKQSQKRGGEMLRHDVAITDVAAVQNEDLLAIDDALTALADSDAVAADLVKLRYFAGLSLPEAAAVLSISPRTADRVWAYARAWLHRELAES